MRESFLCILIPKQNGRVFVACNTPCLHTMAPAAGLVPLVQLMYVQHTFIVNRLGHFLKKKNGEPTASEWCREWLICEKLQPINMQLPLELPAHQIKWRICALHGNGGLLLPWIICCQSLRGVTSFSKLSYSYLALIIAVLVFACFHCQLFLPLTLFSLLTWTAIVSVMVDARVIARSRAYSEISSLVRLDFCGVR